MVGEVGRNVKRQSILCNAKRALARSIAPKSHPHGMTRCPPFCDQLYPHQSPNGTGAWSHFIFPPVAPLFGSALLTGRSCLLKNQGPGRVTGATSGQAAPSPRPVNLPSSLHLVTAFTDSFLSQQTRQ